MQTRPVDRVLVIDNASTDDTEGFLTARGFLNGGVIDYVRLPVNTGSAGGFHEGMRRAYEAGYDWLWLMDDDGYPALNCLEQLLASRSALDVIGPAVVLPDDALRLTWKLRRVHPNGRYKTLRATGHGYLELLRSAPGGIYPGFAALFNGVLINRKVPARIGHVLPDLFIWGDENEYLLRCKSAGFRVGIHVRAVHFHPHVRPRRASRAKFYYLFRNTMFMHHRYATFTLPAPLRPLYPFYISLRLLFDFPSWSPAYVGQVVRGALRALRGELIPFDPQGREARPSAAPSSQLQPRGAAD